MDNIESSRVCQRRLVHSLRQHINDSFQKAVHFTQVQSWRRKSVERSLERQATVSAAQSTSVEIEMHLQELERIPTAFVVVGAGDMRVNGEWRLVPDQVYCRIVASMATVKWDAEALEWQMRWGDIVLYRLPCEGGNDGAATDGPPPLSDAWQQVEGIEPTPSTVASEANQKKRLVHYEVFDWYWQMNPPLLLRSRCLSREGSGFDPTTFETQLHQGGDFEDGEDEAGMVHWRDLRGPYGESILSWLYVLRSHDKVQGRLQNFYQSLTQWILHFEPELAGVRVCHEPYVGQTILHQACAASDVELIDFMVNEPRIQELPFFMDGFLEAPLTGSLIKSIHRVPEVLMNELEEATPPDEDEEWNGCTPLEVACLAPTDDKKCKDIMKLLLQAGATPIICHMNTGEVRYNLLHVVARSSWFHKLDEAPHMSASRMKMIVSLFMSHQSEWFEQWGLAMRSQANSRGITPLQAAAMFGNTEAFAECLDNMKVEVWEWGGKREVGFPLAELDSGAGDEYICALELMTVYKHGHLLSLSLIAEIVTMKWEKFGKLWLVRCLVNQIICWSLTTVVCLDDTAGYSRIRHVARTCLLTLSLTYITTLVLLFALCARDEPWFEHMDFSIFFNNTRKVNFWSILAVRNAFELACMALIAVFPPWYNGDNVRNSQFYGLVWHSLASLWFLSGMSFYCSYLELFKSTSALALAIPEVARRDMVPFFALFMVVYLSCAVALRIAVEGGEAGDKEVTDRTFGSFYGVMKTLEEATHGPDLKWRAAWEGHAQPAGAIFVLFLWVTLIMLSLLIAMFSNTFDALRSGVNERLMFRRAMFCVTIEKLFPQWYHLHRSWGSKGCVIGSRLGVSPADAKQSPGSFSSRPFTPRPVFPMSSPRESETKFLGAGYGATWSQTPGVSPQKTYNSASPAEEDRWLLWAKADTTFETWRRPARVADDDTDGVFSL